jgi:hypothetical protein
MPELFQMNVNTLSNIALIGVSSDELIWSFQRTEFQKKNWFKKTLFSGLGRIWTKFGHSPYQSIKSEPTPSATKSYADISTVLAEDKGVETITCRGRDLHMRSPK